MKYSIAVVAIVAYFITSLAPFASANTSLAVTQIESIQSSAIADGSYESGWKWVFDITVPENETVVAMKFADLSGAAGTIPAANNVRFFSAQSSDAVDAGHAMSVTAALTYSNIINLLANADTDLTRAGKQIQITVEVRVPTGTALGSYSTDYGLKTDVAPVITVDTIAPVITLNGQSDINIDVGTTYAEAGATALDNLDGDISSRILATTALFDTATVGTYTITYNVSDTAGNPATPVQRTVHVISPIVTIDTNAPAITLIGGSEISLIAGSAYVEPGFTATDDVDGDISSRVVITTAQFDLSLPGTYTLTYSVSDTAGNAATPVTRTIIVTESTQI